MLQKLKRIYPSLMPYVSTAGDGYIWFQTEEMEQFGIHETDLTPKDVEILSTLLTRFTPHIPLMTAEAQLWHNRINHNTENEAKESFRFVYFSLTKHQIEPDLFQEAINELFNAQVPILWISECEGILIELIPFLDTTINYEQFIHIFIADLSVNIRFFIGEHKNSYHHLQTYYEELIEMAANIFEINNKEVIYYTEAIPYLLLHHMSLEEKEQLITTILRDFQYDPDMIQTLEAFFEANLNISETAKKLYMHRNSVQYRLDKFMNETGINIQNFNEAIAIKLALLVKNT